MIRIQDRRPVEFDYSFRPASYFRKGAKNELAEIASILLMSTTGCETSVIGQSGDGEVRYSVVGDGETEYTPFVPRSDGPLSFGEIIEFINGTAMVGDETPGGLVLGHINWHLGEGLVDEVRSLMSVKSDFYPELGSFYSTVICDHLENFEEEALRLDLQKARESLRQWALQGAMQVPANSQSVALSQSEVDFLSDLFGTDEQTARIFNDLEALPSGDRRSILEKLSLAVAEPPSLRKPDTYAAKIAQVMNAGKQTRIMKVAQTASQRLRRV